MPRSKHKWTKEELKEIWAKGIKCFPPPKEGERYGCSDKFLPVCVNDVKVKEKFKDADPWLRTHDHRMSVDLLWGGCLKIDTPILMYDGSIKKVQDVVVGDLLMGPDSTPRTVLKLCRGYSKMYEVLADTGESFICNDEHILSLKDNSNNVLNIEVNDYLLSLNNTFKLYRFNSNRKSHFTIRRVDDDYYYGFTLDKDHLYVLAESGIVTHNTGSGKTTHAVALGLQYTFGYPGAKGLVGGNVYKDLYQNVIVQYRDLLTINEYWDHPAVIKAPSEDGHNKILTIEPYPGAKWSEIEFFQFAEWTRVRGRNRDWIHFEEISQLEDESIIDELPRRCRGTLLPVSHIISTTNPPEETTHYIYRKWNVFQHIKGYTDEKTPIGKPCTCQYCQVCINKKLGFFEFDKDYYCTNPECPEIVRKGKPSQKEFYTIQGVRTSCPGNQHYWRVMFSSAVDNPHVRADYVQSQSNSDSRVNQLYVEGTPMELNAATVYDTFSMSNQLELGKEIELDPERDLFWSFDFNNRPQCSVLCQEYYKEDGTTLDYVAQIDEIILYDIKEVIEQENEFGEKEQGASPQHIAAEFMKRYPDFKKKTIYLHGDPTAVNKTSGPLEKTKYQIIYNILTKAGYKVVMMVKKEKGKLRMIPIIDRVNNAKWLFRDNTNTIRFYINQRCKYTISSVKNLKWSKDGEKIEKRLIDEYARRSTETILPEDVYKVIKLVSHPADALTYYLYQKFPLIKDVDVNGFLTIPGESTFMIDGKNIKVIESEYKNKKEDKPNISVIEPNTILDDLKRALGGDDDIGQDDINFFSSFFS